MLYPETKRNSIYGSFNPEHKAGYTLTNGDKLVAPWYYIYQNRKILLYVDQNGPVKIQYQPPSGILLSKREIGETQSKWQVYIKSKDINGGLPFSNFNSPCFNYSAQKPKFKVDWNPSTATYLLEYPQLTVKTEIFVPFDKATVCMKTTLVNTSDKELSLDVCPAVFPYINKPQMVAWDLPEWYLSVKPRLNGNVMSFCGQMRDPDMIEENKRSVTFNVDFEADAEFTCDMANFCGTGNFFAPQSVLNVQSLSNKMENADSVGTFGGHQSAFATKYKTTLSVGESKTYTQVMTVQTTVTYDQKENEYERFYFDQNKYTALVKETDAFYDKLFTERTVKTDNPLYNDFINNFAPLQMYWVCSLDRGWPSSMRGIRDASQDFMGMLHLDADWTKSVIKEMFEHQRTDGWMPRQISTISREAPHDMRYFSDGGAFLLELIHEYLTFTRDFNLLSEEVWWLDSDKKSTVLEHILKTVDFYLDEINIGEHGLCKVWYGDWWDPMDKIGMDGIGETVTVTAQNVLNLKNLADMFKHLCAKGILGKEYLSLADTYLKARENFISAMHKHAYNDKGFFNGYFNDNRKWLLSDCDPDGAERLYLVSNAWAIISGVADDKMTESVINYIDKNDYGSDMGYFTSSKGFPVKIDKAGRKGSGSSPSLATYNHAQSFFVRACCTAGRADLAYKATRHILPIEEAFAPVEKTFAPPYAIVNMYGATHRAGFQFLSGTVSYVLRTVYNFFFGITFGYDGLNLKPCLPKEFGTCSVQFKYLGKKFLMNCKCGQDKSITFNGKKVGELSAFISDSQMKEENIIEVVY